MNAKNTKPIKSYCKSRGIKMIDYAAKLGCSQSFLSQIDSGYRPAPKWLSDKIVLSSGGYIRADQICGRPRNDFSYDVNKTLASQH